MAGIARGDVEILVHTTAPSRGYDDGRYRNLAQAYLDFQPIIRHRLDLEPQSSRRAAFVGDVDTQLEEELPHSMQDERESRASYSPDDEDEFTSESLAQCPSSNILSVMEPLGSPQLSFRSVLDNSDSPAFRPKGPRHRRVSTDMDGRNIQSSVESWQAAPSTVADSQPDYDQSLVALPSPTRVLEIYLQNQTRLNVSSLAEILPRQRDSGLDLHGISRDVGADTPEKSSVLYSPSPQNESTTASAARGGGDILPSREDHLGVLKGKQPLSSLEYAKPPLLVARDDTQASRMVSSDHASSQQVALPETTSLAKSWPEQPLRPSKRQRVDHDSSTFVKITEPSMTPDPTSSMTSNAGSFIWSESLEIRPSAPRTSTANLTAEMLITDPLQQLAKQISSQCQYPFAPCEQTRKLRPMERGYWLVNCERWDSNIRSRCWNVLGKYVGRDLAGWGVSCTRDAETRSIRVYCWGIIAEHIYLLLHMASASKIKGTGACWIGGDGITIITMPE
jgi:hypothetical protein